jgi:hypothetical protein
LKEKKVPKRRCEWLLMKRSKRTGKVIKSVAFPFDLLEHADKQPNFSEYVVNLVRKDMEEHGRTEEREKESAQIELTWIEEAIYNECRGIFAEFGRLQFGEHYEIMPLQPETDLLRSYFHSGSDIAFRIKENYEEDAYKEIMSFLEIIHKDNDLWDKLYAKFCLYWRQCHPVPEEYKKEVIRGWTIYEALAKCVSTAKDGMISVSYVAQALGTDYQTAYNKVVPIVRPILEKFGVKIV